MSSRNASIGLNNLPVVRVLVPFAGGVLAGQEWGEVMGPGLQLILLMVGWLAIFLLHHSGNMDHSSLHGMFGLLGFLLFAGLGFLTGRIALTEAPLLPAGERVLVRGRVTGEPEISSGRWYAEMEMLMLATGDTFFHGPTTLGVRMELPQDSVCPKSGEEWQMAGMLQPVRNNGNPGETDYASILGRRDYWFRLFVEADSPWNRRTGPARSGRFSASALRASLSRLWQGDPEAVLLLKAVCLGDRSQLTPSLREAYAGAGGMHLLAVSGLHVGLIWWVLQHLFSFLVRLTRTELARVIPTLLLLWGYAYVTGMSSSVTRSVTMFTLFTLARLIHNRTHSLHTLFVAAFLMAVIMPGKLKEVGFQLSYSAVLGIITLFPLFQRFSARIPHRILRWLWEASAVSLSAQVTTAPLVIYYFQQYPAYALLTNLVAIPLMGGLIALFVVSVPFFLLGWFPLLWNRLLTLPAAGLNRLMTFVSELPGAEIPVTGIHEVVLLCWMGILFGAMVALKVRHRLPSYAAVFLLGVLIGDTAVRKGMRKHSGELVVTHFNGGSLMLFREGAHLDCYRWGADSALVRSMEQYVQMAWGGGDFQIRWIDVEKAGKASGQVSACQWLAPGIARVGNDRIRGWILLNTPSRRQIQVIERHPGRLLLISGEPSLPAAPLDRLSGGCPVILDGNCRRWYRERITAGHPLIHSTFRDGAYRKTW